VETPIPSARAPTLDFVARKKRKDPPLSEEPFGQRLRRLRLAKGLTQAELGRTVGLSNRMVAYYEIQGGVPSSELFKSLAEALGVSMDALAGLERTPKRTAPTATENPRLWRRLKRIEELPVHDRKAVLKMIDAMADAVRRKAS
jgi:transcriptional regulator with XRE-family HTH domain